MVKVVEPPLPLKIKPQPKKNLSGRIVYIEYYDVSKARTMIQ